MCNLSFTEMRAPRPDEPVAGTRFRTRWLGEASSTNTVAAAAAAAGEPEGLAVAAEHQTAGRGRLGRSWVAPAGSALLTSVLLRPPPAATQLAVTAVGCAAAAACARLSGVEPGLKWPNDLIVGGRKLGGILAEAATGAGNVTAVVVGLGLNTARPRHVPEDLAPVATWLDRHTQAVPERRALLSAILIELEPRYQALTTGGPQALLAEYRRRCVTIDQPVRVEQADRTLEGTAVAVDDGAALIIRTTAGTTVRVDVGDVVHVRPA